MSDASCREAILPRPSGGHSLSDIPWGQQRWAVHAEVADGAMQGRRGASFGAPGDRRGVGGASPLR